MGQGRAAAPLAHSIPTCCPQKRLLSAGRGPERGRHARRMVGRAAQCAWRAAAMRKAFYWLPIGFQDSGWGRRHCPPGAAPGGGGSGGGSTGRAAPSAALLWLLLIPPPGQPFVGSRSSACSKRWALCCRHRELRGTCVCRRPRRRTVAAAGRWSSHYASLHTLTASTLSGCTKGGARQHGGTRSAGRRANRRGWPTLPPPLGARERRPAAAAQAGQADHPGLD